MGFITHRSSASHEVFFEVDFKHTYYDNLVCNDFKVTPTAFSADLIEELNLIFKPKNGGFKILYDTNKVDSISRDINIRIENSKKQYGKPAWPRLSFEMRSINPLFINFSDYADPDDEKFFEKTLYFCNLNAHKDKYNDNGGISSLLTRGSWVSKEEMLDLNSASLEVDVPDNKSNYKTSICDIAGIPVLSQNSCRIMIDPRFENFGGRSNMVKITHYLEKLYKRGISGRAESAPVENQMECTDRVFFDLTTCPAGKYTIEIENDGEKCNEDEPFVFPGSGHPPLGFLDILFTKPTDDESAAPDDGAFFPLRDGVVESQFYLVRFNTRRTTWRYYIVFPENWKGEHFHVKDKSGRPEIEFVDIDKGVPRRFGENRWTLRFDSKPTIALHDLSPYKFELVNSEPEPIIRHLDTAAARQIIPRVENGKEVTGEEDNKKIYSDMYIYV